MQTLRQFALLLSVFVLVACSGEPPQLTPLDPNRPILAFGDSLTYGKGVGEEQAYPAVLERLIGIPVINAGISGEESSEGLERLPRLLEETQPQLVVLCHGGNDLLRKRNLDTLQNNLRQMIRIIRESGAEVILLGVPEPKLLLRTAPDFYENLAKEFDIPYDGEVIPEVESDDDLKSDPFHPNAAGYRMMAEAVYSLLKARRALPPG